MVIQSAEYSPSQRYRPTNVPNTCRQPGQYSGSWQYMPRLQWHQIQMERVGNTVSQDNGDCIRPRGIRPHLGRHDGPGGMSLCTEVTAVFCTLQPVWYHTIAPYLRSTVTLEWRTGAPRVIGCCYTLHCALMSPVSLFVYRTLQCTLQNIVQ